MNTKHTSTEPEDSKVYVRTVTIIYVSSCGSGGSTLGPGGHRPPKSCPGPPNFVRV